MAHLLVSLFCWVASSVTMEIFPDSSSVLSESGLNNSSGCACWINMNWHEGKILLLLHLQLNHDLYPSHPIITQHRTFYLKFLKIHLSENYYLVHFCPWWTLQSDRLAATITLVGLLRNGNTFFMSEKKRASCTYSIVVMETPQREKRKHAKYSGKKEIEVREKSEWGVDEVWHGSMDGKCDPGEESREKEEEDLLRSWGGWGWSDPRHGQPRRHGNSHHVGLPRTLCLDVVCVSIPVAIRVFDSQCVLNFKLRRIF